METTTIWIVAMVKFAILPTVRDAVKFLCSKQRAAVSHNNLSRYK